MSGLWLVSYLALWGLVIILSILVLGCLQQIGLLQRQVVQKLGKPETSPPPVEHDGPPIGSRLPDLVLETINDFGTFTLSNAEQHSGILVVFLSSLCESCQHVVDPLNALVASQKRTERVVVLLRADDQGCRAFLSVFPLHLPVVCDSTRAITQGFDVHANPFGLLYDASGILIRKGILMRADDLRALFGDEGMDQRTREHIFPPPKTVDTSVAAEAENLVGAPDEKESMLDRT